MKIVRQSTRKRFPGGLGGYEPQASIERVSTVPGEGGAGKTAHPSTELELQKPGQNILDRETCSRGEFLSGDRLIESNGFEHWRVRFGRRWRC